MSATRFSSRVPLDLRDAGETYRLLVEGIPGILYLDSADAGPTNLYTSPQVEELLGYAAAEWRSSPETWLDLVHPDDRDRVARARGASLQAATSFAAEYRVLAADGRVVWLRDEAVLVHDASGEPLYWRGIVLDVTEHKRVEARLRSSLEELERTVEERRRLLAQVEEAQEEERRRIAGDIHDDSLQVISAADIRVQALARQLDSPELRAEADELHATLREAVQRLRHLLFELRPPAFDREGLVGAVRSYLDHADPAKGTRFEVESSLERDPPAEIGAALFRIAREAIANAVKHARAKHVTVGLAPVESGVYLRVADDGRGFEAIDVSSPQPGHLGLPTMVERAEVLGGWCRVDSTPGRGTVVRCWIPAGAQPPTA